MAHHPFFVFSRSLILAGLIALPTSVIAAPSVQPPVVSPSSVSVAQSTGLSVTAYVKGDATNPVIATGVNLLRLDATGKVLATLGRMWDDGTNGDAVAGDGIFTRNISVNEPVVGDIRLQISAAFYKLLSRVKSSVTLVPILVPIVEKINGIAVPPKPDATTNQATLSGVDSDNNGIRDDIDRLIAQEFGTNPANYVEASNYARTQQAAITSPSPETVAQHINLLRCINDIQKLDDLKKITMATMDTGARRAAYGNTFAGAVISSEGCAQ